MKEMLLKTFILFFTGLFVIVNISFAKTPRYPNTYAKDFMADAPWRVQGTDIPIPVGFFIKDSDVNDLPDLDSAEIYLLKKDGSKERIYYHSFNGMAINQSYWEWIAEEFKNAKEGSLNGKPITAENLGYEIGEAIDLEAWIKGSDDWWQGGSFSFSRRLRIYVGEPFPRPNSDWLYGDAHYHTRYTNNPYEYGAGLGIISAAVRAMGLDWITTTDHASNFLDWDLNASRWVQLKNDINRYNDPASGLPFIIGEEISCEPVAGTDHDNIHLLSYNNDTFIPGTINTFNDAMLSLESRLALAESEAGVITFAAHPSDRMDIFGFGDIRPWSDANYQTALQFQNFYGLEVWNTRTTMTTSPGGNLDHINPFTGINGGWAERENENHFLPDLEAGIAVWTNLLEENLSPIRKIVINAGSDAHGDLNYTSYVDKNLERLTSDDNAIGKARTLVYSPEHSKNSVLHALKNGHSIITDGPVLLIGVDTDHDGLFNKKGGDTIVGDILPVVNADRIPLLIRWQLYNDKPIEAIRIFLGQEIIHEFRPEGGASQGSKTIEVSLEGMDANSYLRAECVTDSFVNDSDFGDRYRAYTNPVWLQFSDVVQGDINGDRSVDLQDTILILKILSGLKPNAFIHIGNEVGEDGRIGIEDAIYTLEKICE